MPYSVDDPTRPIYQEVPGWGDTEGNVVPAQLEAYIHLIEKAVGVPVKLVSLGPDRSQTILRGQDITV